MYSEYEEENGDFLTELAWFFYSPKRVDEISGFKNDYSEFDLAHIVGQIN